MHTLKKMYNILVYTFLILAILMPIVIACVNFASVNTFDFAFLKPYFESSSLSTFYLGMLAIFDSVISLPYALNELLTYEIVIFLFAVLLVFIRHLLIDIWLYFMDGKKNKM